MLFSRKTNLRAGRASAIVSFMKTANKYDTAFWRAVGHRQHTAEEKEALRELVALVEEEKKAEEEAVAKWLG